jgi:WhiB family transcriptional regulator, redox-sensing transcriptional regulator
MTAPRLDSLGRRIPPDADIRRIQARHTRFDSGPRAWVEQAACQGHDPELWFPEAPRPGRWNLAAAAEAKQVCRGCPVTEACLSHAIRANEAGIWGGMSETERQTLRAKKGRK